MADALREIKNIRAKIVMVQLPEGLKGRAAEIAAEIEGRTGATAIVSVNPCFGACDLADCDAAALGADLLVHIGHAEMPSIKPCIKTVFVPLHYKVSEGETKRLAWKAAEEIKKIAMRKDSPASVSLCAVVQYAKMLPIFRKELESAGLEVRVGKGGRRLSFAGQVLGCDYSAVAGKGRGQRNEDVVVLLADGLFHALGAAYQTSRPVVLVNPLEKRVVEIKNQKEEFLRKRFGVIARARGAEKFGIIISTKAGQMQRRKALDAARMLEEAGKKALLVAADLVREEFLLGIDAECFVCTACPRIALEDGLHWKRPVLTFSELEILLGKRKAGDYPAGGFCLT